MTYKLFLLPAVMAASSLTIAADSIDDRVGKLENDIRILKSQNESSQAQAIRFNGFFSVGATSASNNLGYVGSNNRYDFDELTKLGLQASFEVDDKTSVTTQMLSKSKGTDNFEAKMEWAYVSHTFDNDSTLRAGRLRAPLFMYSDFLDVGLAQVWARPPEEVYSPSFTAYLGVDYSKNFDLDDSTLNFNVYGGEAEFVAGPNNIVLPRVGGVVATWNNDTLTLRGTYLLAKGVNNTQDDGQFYGLAATYDNGSLLLLGELTEVDSDDLNSPSNQAMFVTLGYRIDALLPYATIARIESTKDDERPVGSGLTYERDTYSLGAKYNLASNMSIKADATLVTNFAGTSGGIQGNTTYNDSVVYSVRLDTVF